MTLSRSSLGLIKRCLARSGAGALSIYILGAWSANLAAAEAFEGVITARRGSTIERYSIQGQRIRFESEDAGRTEGAVIVDFAAKKKYLLLGINSSRSHELWGDDLDPPPRAAGRDGGPMMPATDTGVAARATGRTTTIAGLDAEEFVEYYGDSRPREIWATKTLGLSPLTIRRLREGSSIVNGFIDERLIGQGYFPLRIAQRSADAASVVRFEIVAIERRPLAAGVFDPGYAAPADKKLPFWYFASGTLVDVASLKRPTERDVLWAYLAFELNEPALCERITQGAYVSAGLFGGELFNQIGLKKSQCYADIAMQYRVPQLCDKVTSIRSAYASGGRYSSATCREEVAGFRAGNRSVSSPSDRLLVVLFRQLGYDIEQLHLEGVTRPAIGVQDLYSGLGRDPAVVARIRQLLARPTSSLSAEDLGYLSHLAAMATGDADFCAAVPARLHVAEVEAPFRDWCFYTVASNAWEVRICDRMTPAAAEATVISAKAAGIRPRIAEQMGLYAKCADIGREGQLKPSGRYSAQVPKDESHVRRLLTALGVVVPLARDWSEEETARFYRGFLSELSPDRRPPDPVRNAARAKLLSLLLALPRDVP